jgi:hypothetical protein
VYPKVDVREQVAPVLKSGHNELLEIFFLCACCSRDNKIMRSLGMMLRAWNNIYLGCSWDNI